MSKYIYKVVTSLDDNNNEFIESINKVEPFKHYDIYFDSYFDTDLNRTVNTEYKTLAQLDKFLKIYIDCISYR